ncbi:hypothetical protein ACRALDRAFT_205759 [Sodiomyces alcalophilus JCM 7366]|uniref:uncharacterized protein n=1 Tax=Sodiomyces alcalophilus JCM 7366 TaxID=591952 RepID=UPI0039B4504E
MAELIGGCPSPIEVAYRAPVLMTMGFPAGSQKKSEIAGQLQHHTHKKRLGPYPCQRDIYFGRDVTSWFATDEVVASQRIMRRRTGNADALTSRRASRDMETKKDEKEGKNKMVDASMQTDLNANVINDPIRNASTKSQTSAQRHGKVFHATSTPDPWPLITTREVYRPVEYRSARDGTDLTNHRPCGYPTIRVDLAQTYRGKCIMTYFRPCRAELPWICVVRQTDVALQRRETAWTVNVP